MYRIFRIFPISGEIEQDEGGMQNHPVILYILGSVRSAELVVLHPFRWFVGPLDRLTDMSFKHLPADCQSAECVFGGSRTIMPARRL